MIIIGLSCPICGGVVLDSGDKCSSCGAQHNEQIIVAQREHHDLKMQQIGLIQDGSMTEIQAVLKLAKFSLSKR